MVGMKYYIYILERRRKRRHGKLDIKFKNYYYKHFVFIRP